MIIIPKNFQLGRYYLHSTDETKTITYVATDRSRLQVTCGSTSFSAYWTPREYLGDCLSRIHQFAFLAHKESWLNAEFSDGEKIVTQEWRPALARVCQSPDADLRYVEFSSEDNRSIYIASLSNDEQLDIGISAELDMISSLRDAIFITAAPKTVKIAFNRVLMELFAAKYSRLHISVATGDR